MPSLALALALAALVVPALAATGAAGFRHGDSAHHRSAHHSHARGARCGGRRARSRARCALARRLRSRRPHRLLRHSTPAADRAKQGVAAAGAAPAPSTPLQGIKVGLPVANPPAAPQKSPAPPAKPTAPAPAPAQPAGGERAPLRIGLNANTQGWGLHSGTEQDNVAPTGVKWLREEFHWDVIEPQRGQWDWSRYDVLFTEAARRGMHVLPLLMDVPGWAAPTTNTIPADPADYADYVAHVVARYGPGGTFWRDHADIAGYAPVHFELWNEPYVGPFSDGGVDPGRYARLVKASVQAGRAANPAARFLLEAELSWTNDFRSYHEWVDALYAAVPDLGQWFDGVAVHPYGDRGPNYYTPGGDTRWQTRRLEQIHDKFAAHGDGDKHFWITEVGWTTCTGNSDCVTEQQQADFFGQMASLVRSRYPFVDALFFYGWRDLGTDPADKEQHFGIMRRDGSHKPAWDALRAITAAG